ncbi:TetR/AcrR family transcriptional regulator [Yinghuangia soli]|uniref:TetR family transcriptional regulator n=1 Tax=Yinghuangia soli TaxID=2908204 RepID=A0AA41Q3Y2_9ACTN|nr:TetR/AcrR family transcriptional regulator [Yinghuangia soli]MCF2531100.1 TetR family transcriptional regulator [Yinghuangia soli]
MTQGSTGGPTRGRGRPARLSREQIVEAAVGLVYDDPTEPLTIKRVADAADSAPMALYRYFPDRDDLLHAVADRVLADMRFTAPEGLTWQEKLREWMLLSLEHLRPYPQLLPYIASTRQPAWLPSFSLLTGVLSPLRLDDEDMALAIALVGTTIVGQATLAAKRTPSVDMVPLMKQALEQATEEEQRRVGPVVDALPTAFERLYDVVIDSTVDAIAAMANRSGKGVAKSGRPRVAEARQAALVPIFSSTGLEP